MFQVSGCPDTLALETPNRLRRSVEIARTTAAHLSPNYVGYIQLQASAAPECAATIRVTERFMRKDRACGFLCEHWTIRFTVVYSSPVAAETLHLNRAVRS
jgi:hypothetical protein